VVDDELDIAELVVEVLGTDGYRVELAENGARALELLGQGPYDAVLTDAKMPVLDGEGFYREVERRYPALRGRVAFLSGNVLSPEMRAFVDRTGIPTIEKPFQMDAVRRVVRRLLGDD
jgi:CheY-like chemotaxis protein